MGQAWTFFAFHNPINIPKDSHIMDFDNATIVLILYCVLAFVLAFYPAYLIFPRFIRRMKALGNTEKDVNKRGNIQVAKP
jgi:Kef-type K+ transport system membrane component KefB